MEVTMNELSLEKLASDLEQLKRENRRLKWIVLAVVIFTGSMLLVGYEMIPSVIKAERFEVWKNGKMQAVLAVNEAGSPHLTLYDENGKLRAALAVTEAGPDLRLADENGKLLGQPR